MGKEVDSFSLWAWGAGTPLSSSGPSQKWETFESSSKSKEAITAMKIYVFFLSCAVPGIKQRACTWAVWSRPLSWATGHQSDVTLLPQKPAMVGVWERSLHLRRLPGTLIFSAVSASFLAAPPKLHCGQQFLFLLIFLKSFMNIFLHVRLCTMCVPGDQGDQKTVSDTMELKLQTIVKCNVGAGNGSWVLWKISECS